eukprot:GSA25T00027545001.1
MSSSSSSFTGQKRGREVTCLPCHKCKAQRRVLFGLADGCTLKRGMDTWERFECRYIGVLCGHGQKESASYLTSRAVERVAAVFGISAESLTTNTARAGNIQEEL